MFIGKANLVGTTISTDKSINETVPFVLTEELLGKQSFEVEVVKVGNQGIWIGVLAADLKNTIGNVSHADSLAIGFSNGQTNLHLEGKLFTLPTFPLKNGSVISVTVDCCSQEVEWRQLQPVRQVIHREPTPKGLQGKVLVPAVHLNCSGGNSIRFN